MFFWIFSLISALLVPATMVIFGFVWKRRPPRDINSAYGYRTARSTRSPEAWAFAHAVISRIWRVWGLVLTAATVLGFLLGSMAIAGWRPADIFAPEHTDAIGFLLLAICGVQLAVMLCSIIPVERALKRSFDGE